MPPIIDRESLVSAISEGRSCEFLFFWGHHPRKRGVVDHSCLSQWYPASFQVENREFQSAEQYMMAEKARLFEDRETLELILASPDPKEAKRLGRRVAQFDEEIWRAARFDVVSKGNLAKFGQNPDLGAFLLSTDDRVLVEASPYDQVWGIGLPQSHRDAREPRLWPGLNLLGFALMKVRGELAARSA